MVLLIYNHYTKLYKINIDEEKPIEMHNPVNHKQLTY